MNDYEIRELVDNINESYSEFLNKKRGERYAIARLFDEFGYSEDEIEEIITNMAIGEIIITQESVFRGNFNSVMKSLKKYDESKVKLKGFLLDRELNEITFRINKVINSLSKMKIVNDPYC